METKTKMPGKNVLKSIDNGLAPVSKFQEMSGSVTMEKLQQLGEDTSLGIPGQQSELASIHDRLTPADSSYITDWVYSS